MAVKTLQLKERDEIVLDIRLELDEAHANHRTILNDLNAGFLYEPDVAGALRRILSPGDTFVDVGANIGFHTLVAAYVVGARGRVISFEPGSNALVELQNNVALNNFQNVTIVNKAVTDRAGETEFFLNSDDTGGNALWDPAIHPANRTPASRTRVQSTRLDEALSQLLGEKFPKAIKIDTEGAELLVLRGAESLLSPARVPYVICEFFEFGMRQLAGDAAQLRGFMREKGYDTFVLSRRDTFPLFVPPGTRIASKFIVNLVFSTAELISKCWPRAEFPTFDY